MRFILLLAALAWNSASLSAQTDKEARMHIETSFDLVIHSPYPEAAVLFGPEGERPWAGDQWNPQFIHPLPARDVQGAVFMVNHDPLRAVWVTTQADLTARHFQYVYFLPELMVTTIDVRFEPEDDKTSVHVSYARTAISPEGDHHVAAMSEIDRRAGSEWQKAIDHYLESRALVKK